MTRRPAELSRALLAALEAGEGRRRKRKRVEGKIVNIVALKRELLERALRDDPEPERFEAWLLERCLAGGDTHSVGSLLRMSREILDEYRLTARLPAFDAWLAAGAPSEDRLA